MYPDNLGFFGNITSVVTHELNNVITIFTEQIGLLEDITYSISNGGITDANKLKKLHTKMAEQAQRGEILVKNLNKFAHTTDIENCEFNLNQVIGNLISLSQRPAKNKKVELCLGESFIPVTAIGNPFELQRIIYIACIKLIEITDVGGRITVDVYADDQGDPHIRITAEPTDSQLAENDINYLKNSAIDYLKGNLNYFKQMKILEIEILLPHSISGKKFKFK